MKTLKLLFLLATVSFFSSQIYAQTQPTVYAVVSKAKWCPTCKKNDVRVGEEVLSKVDANKISVLINDLSDKETKTKSAATLKENGLENLKLKSTGVITFIDATTKKVISSISVAESSEAILKEFNNVSLKM